MADADVAATRSGLLERLESPIMGNQAAARCKKALNPSLDKAQHDQEPLRGESASERSLRGPLKTSDNPLKTTKNL